MTKHPYRALFIWAVIIVSLVTIYPTVGWMVLDNDEAWLKLSEDEREATMPQEGTRQYRLVAWEQQDAERAAIREPGIIQKLGWKIRRWTEFDREQVINLGLDLQGGVHMVLGFSLNELPPDRLQELKDEGYSDEDIQEQVQQMVLQQITRRVNDFEAKEPVIQALGDSQVQIMLPGEKDIERAKRLITKTAKLDFHLVNGPDASERVLVAIRDAFPNQFLPYINQPKLPGDPLTISLENHDRVRDVLVEAHENGVVPEDKLVALSQPPKPFEEQSYEIYVLDREPLQSGEDLVRSSALPDQQNPPYWQIMFQLSNEAGAEFREKTEAAIGRPMAIVLDGMVVSAPVIRDAISTNGQISGAFSGPEATDLSIALNSGSMVVPVHEEYTGVVDPTLGAESVHRGVVSAIAGVIIVAIFIAVYYLSAGLIAVVALALNAVFIVAAMAYFDMTLTLPGIAGLILTIGMAVDANVLIFERIREELKLGHSLVSSVDTGFKKAAIPILDANVTTLIAAAVLFQFGTGPIEGFAITLSIGVICSVFAALVVSRAIFDAVVGRKLVQHLPMMSFFKPDTQIPFLRARNPAIIASIVLIVVGLINVIGVRGSDMFGVDFAEGTNVRLTLDNPNEVSVADVRSALTNAGFASPIVQAAGAGVAQDINHFIIRVAETPGAASVAPEASSAETAAPEAVTPETAMPEDSAGDTALVGETVSSRIQNALAPLTGPASAEGVRLDEVQTVGPAVGKQLRIDAMLALFWALVFVVLYLAFRFELKFAVGAVVAIIHDVLVTLVVIAFFRFEITMSLIAALLTIVGYSLNDTIVIFDRVREQMVLKRGKGHKLLDLLNESINATLSRTLLTSLTTNHVVRGRRVADFRRRRPKGFRLGIDSGYHCRYLLDHLHRQPGGLRVAEVLR